MQQISLCLTNYNRTDLLIDSFKKVYADSRISEIVISDDHSDREVYNELQSIFHFMPKVTMYRQEKNIDCYRNKAAAIHMATNQFCILLDSDNCIDTSYIDKIYEHEWSHDTALMPSFARPLFDYREFAGLTITKENVAQYMDKPFFSTMLNCANYFVSRKMYLQCFDDKIEPHTADSIFMNWRLLDDGGKIKVVKGMEYDHLVHDGSHYKQNNHKTGDFYNEVESLLVNMK